MNNFGMRILDCGLGITNFSVLNPKFQIPKSKINNLLHPVVSQILFQNDLDITVV